MDQINCSNESPPPPPTELTNTTACTNLQEMIDDCLREIFKVKTLDVMDLCSVAETCTRFRQVAQSVFPKAIVIAGDMRTGTYPSYYVRPKTKKRRIRKGIERIFKNFGAILSHVEIINDQFLLKLVAKYCSGGDSLKGLSMSSIGFSQCDVELQQIFKELQTLELKRVCLWDDEMSLFTGLDSLVELRVSFGSNCAQILRNNFPKLERFRFEIILTDPCEMTLSIVVANFVTFIYRHDRLKTLHLTIRTREAICARHILEAIGSGCRELESLSVEIGTMEGVCLQPLKTFKLLRTVEIKRASMENFESLSVLPQMRELHLHFCRLPENLDQFNCLNQLTKLELLSCGNSIDLVHIIHRLKHLEDFTVYSTEYKAALTEMDFGKIVDIVKQRPHVLTLKCLYRFRLTNNHKNQRVRLLDAYSIMAQIARHRRDAKLKWTSVYYTWKQ